MNAWLSDRDPSNAPGRGRGGVNRPKPAGGSGASGVSSDGDKVVASPLILSPLFAPIELSSSHRRHKVSDSKWFKIESSLIQLHLIGLFLAQFVSIVGRRVAIR